MTQANESPFSFSAQKCIYEGSTYTVLLVIKETDDLYLEPINSR